MPKTYTIAIGSDHAGFKYKEILKAVLLSDGHSVRDLGTDSEQPCDYPDFIRPVAEAVARGSLSGESSWAGRATARRSSPTGSGAYAAAYAGPSRSPSGTARTTTPTACPLASAPFRRSRR